MTKFYLNLSAPWAVTTWIKVGASAEGLTSHTNRVQWFPTTTKTPVATENTDSLSDKRKGNKIDYCDDQNEKGQFQLTSALGGGRWRR